MADHIDWPGASGKTYRYWYLPSLAPTAIRSEPGNYLFVKQTPTGLLPVYAGQAQNLRDRLPTHERWGDARMRGATMVMAHTSPADEGARCAEEKDLIARWNPVCNTQHRTTPAPVAKKRLG